MNITVESKVKVFTPVKVTFEIATKRDLEFLVAIMNSSTHTVKDFVNQGKPVGVEGFSLDEVETIWVSYKAWKQLSEML